MKRPIPARAAVLFAAILCTITACGGGGSAASGTTGGSGTGTGTGETALQTLDRMQAQGLLPTLDVSTTISGTDADGNGVRDDIDRFIAAQSDTPTKKAALAQLAKSLQTTLTVDPSDRVALTSASSSVTRSVACIWSAYGRTQASAKVTTLEELTANTQQRFAAYDAYNAALNGTATTLPKGVVCDA
jgi:hypothetical protein